MSVFAPGSAACPSCSQLNHEDLVVSLNAARTPAAVQAVLDGTFQTFTCARCRQPYSVDGPYFYVDFDAGHWVGVFPGSWEPSWAHLEAHPAAAFHRHMVEYAPRFLRESAGRFAVRSVFGTAQLAEKLRAWRAGWDDVAVEAAKLEVMAGGTGPIGMASRPVLVAAGPDGAVFAPPHADGPTVDVPAHQLRHVASHDGWGPARATLSEGPYVNVGRLLQQGTAQRRAG